MVIVLDTNVLVAGLLNPFGPPGRILELILSGEIQMACDDRLLAEYRDVLTRDKFGFDLVEIAGLLTDIEADCQRVMAAPLNVELPDPDDRPLLEVACAAQADALVIGNTRHYPASSRHGVAVLAPGEFLARWMAQHADDR
jgi:putative PIN family toxin of toxin-antitoxin system